jgi:hypothetical protein
MGREELDKCIDDAKPKSAAKTSEECIRLET